MAYRLAHDPRLRKLEELVAVKAPSERMGPKPVAAGLIISVLRWIGDDIEP